MHFSVEDNPFDIECVVTNHGHVLINASQYATALTGCAPKDATNNLFAVSNRFPELQHCKRFIREHDKVSMFVLVNK